MLEIKPNTSENEYDLMRKEVCFGTLNSLKPLSEGVTEGVHTRFSKQGAKTTHKVFVKSIAHPHAAKAEYVMQKQAYRMWRAGTAAAARVPQPDYGVFFNKHDGSSVIMMKKIAGAQSLGALLADAKSSFMPKRKLDTQIVSPALRGVAALLKLFDGRLEHHDLHLGNIVRGEHEKWYVIDYGRAKAVTNGKKHPSSDLRMTFVCLHEQLRGQKLQRAQSPATFYANKIGECVKFFVRRLTKRKQLAPSARVDKLFELDGKAPLVRLLNSLTEPRIVLEALSTDKKLNAATDSAIDALKQIKRTSS